MKRLISLFALFCLATLAWADQKRTDVDDRLQSATKTLQEILNAPDKGIPQDVLRGAKCVAVVPREIKGGFVFGARHGRGVSTCKLPDGAWSAPAFFTVTGGSWGAQIGVENVELVMMVMNDDGMRQLLQSKFKIGAGASATVGPVGRAVSASESWKLNAPILTYSRAQGLFAGADLNGTEVEKDADSTKAMYRRDLSNTAILTGKVPVPPAARDFVATVRNSTSSATVAKR